MTDSTPHARAFDLPGWPCPPRVRDIPQHYNSWGFVDVHSDPTLMAVVQDELGYLWADGNVIPQFRLIKPDLSGSPGAILYQAAVGLLGVYVHPKSLAYIGSISRLDMEPDRWIPIAEVATDLPEFVKAAR